MASAVANTVFSRPILRQVDGCDVEIERTGHPDLYRLREPQNRTFLRLHIACLNLGIDFDPLFRSWTMSGAQMRDVLESAGVAPLTPRKVVRTSIGRLLLSPTKIGTVRIQILELRAGRDIATAALASVGARRARDDVDETIWFAKPEQVTALIQIPTQAVAVPQPSRYIEVEVDQRAIRIWIYQSGKPDREWYRQNRLIGVVTVGVAIVEMYDLDPDQGDWVVLWPKIPSDNAAIKQRLPYGRHVPRFGGYLVYRDELGFLSGSASALL